MPSKRRELILIKRIVVWTKVHGSFIKSGCVTRLHLFIATKVVGGQSALSWCGDLGTNLIADATDWKILSVQPLGQDFHLIAEPMESS